MEFKDLRPCNPDSAADILGISRRTVFRYDNDAPRLAMLAAAHVAGLIHSEHWHGWKITQDALISPFGDVFQVNNILAMSYERQLIAELKKQVRELRKELNTLRRPKPLPANDPIYTAS